LERYKDMFDNSLNQTTVFRQQNRKLHSKSIRAQGNVAWTSKNVVPCHYFAQIDRRNPAEMPGIHRDLNSKNIMNHREEP